MNLPAWSNVPAAIAADPTLSTTAKLVALGIGVHTDARGRATVSRSRLAVTIAVSLPTVKRGLRELEREGWIVVTRSRQGPQTNQINAYRWSTSMSPKGQATKPPRARVTSDPGGGVKSHPKGGVRADPHTKSSYTNREPAPVSDAVRSAWRDILQRP